MSTTPKDLYDLKDIPAQHLEEAVKPDRDVFAYGLSDEENRFLESFDADRRRKMYRKIDWRLMPVLAFLYLVAHIDRGNIGNAKIENMDKDLGIVGTQWNVCLSIFFVSYLIFELPSNMILQRYFRHRPSLWMGIICTAWGIVTTFICRVQNYQGLVAARFVLGIAEAGFYPGAVLICSYWYPRYMLQTRIALFYTSSATSGAFSGLLAFAIAKLDGTAGLAEGIVTVCVGIAMPFILIDTPSSSKWLDADEQRYVALALTTQDGGNAGQAHSSHVSWATVKQTLGEWHIYFFSFIFWSAAVPNTAFTFNLPSITRGMGYSNSVAQLLTMPPYFMAAMSAWLFGVWADKSQRRYPFIIGPSCLVIIAMAIMIPLAPRITQNIGPAYFAVCIAQIGIYPLNPCVNAWNANSLAGPAKRAMGMATMVTVGGLGSIMGSYIFIQSEAPRYPTGYGVCMAMSFVGITSATILFFNFRYINRKREAMSDEEIREKYTDEELAALGDRSPLYRYTL